MRPLLMVAYHYPPEGGSSGVLRTLKFSKYLPHHGWRPHVLTLREPLYRVRDDQLLAEIGPETTVHRTRAFDTSRHFAFRGRYPAALTVPDRFVSWLPFGVARGLRVVRRHGIRALYSTSPQPTAHLIAMSLKRLTGLPWVADFRDPWIEEGVQPAAGTLRIRVESHLERLVMTHADRVVATTPYLRGDLLRRYPHRPADSVQVIYNGFDEADFAGAPAAVRAGRFELLHTGLVTADYRHPGALFEALGALLAAGQLDRHTVRLVFLGGGKFPDSKAFAGLVTASGLQGVVEVVPRVSHREALARQQEAACLLLLQASADTKSLIPAKAFEYLRSGRPVLALIPPGATAELLKDTEHCHVVDPSDGTRLRTTLEGLYDQWRNSPAPIVARRPIARFERAALTGELAALLNDLVPESPRG